MIYRHWKNYVAIILCSISVCPMLCHLSVYIWVISLCSAEINQFILLSSSLNNAVTCRVNTRSATFSFPGCFWWSHRKTAVDNCVSTQLLLFYLISVPLRGSTLTSSSVFVYPRERKWSKIGNLAEFPKTTHQPPTTTTAVALKDDTSVSQSFLLSQISYRTQN